MEVILLILFIFVALLPTTIATSIFTRQRRNRLWARIWTILANIGGLGLIALLALISLSSYRPAPGERHSGTGFMVAFVIMAWIAQLIVIGIVALALRVTKHVTARAVAPSGTPDDSLAAPAARREEAPPRRGFLWILWIVIAEFLPVSALLLIALFVLAGTSGERITYLSWCMHAVCTPLLPLALAFIVTGHRWRAHVWAAFWYIVAVPGAIGLVIRLFPSLVQSGPLFEGLEPGYYADWARIYPVIFVLAAVSCVVTFSGWLARANPMWRWAFTWATIGYVFLALLGLAMR